MAAPRHRKPSIRLVTRQVSELLMARAARWERLAQIDPTDSLIFAVVLSAGIAHLPLRDARTGRFHGIEDAEKLGRPITATAIALSMALPLTTVRRRAAQLVATELLVRQRGGFAIAPPCFTASKLANVNAAHAHDLIAMLRVLADAGYPPAVRAIAADIAALPPGVVERPLLAFAMRAMETFAELYGDLTASTIVSAILALNIRHITHDPVLSLRYAGEDTPPGDDVRRPVSLRTVAATIDIPFETVRRRVAMLVAEGVIVRHSDGVTVPTRIMLSERIIDNNRRIVGHFETMLDTLVAVAGGNGD